MTEPTLADNVAAAVHAADVAACVDPLYATTPRVWERLAEICQERLAALRPAPAPRPPTGYGPLGESLAAKFEQDGIPFGMFIGRPVGEIPVEYLVRITGGDDSQFMATLRRYVASERFARRAKQEGVEL